MDRFVYGSDLQFDNLEASLQDGYCRVFSDVELPAGFNVSRCRIGFEKHSETSSYKILIDNGISCPAYAPQYFKNFLSEGEVNFMDYYDVKSFFKNLRCLYSNR